MYGSPKFHINSRNHIIITAEASETSDDRLVGIIGDESMNAWLDFSTVVKRYKPLGPGFRFEPLLRSETDPNEFSIHFKEGESPRLIQEESGALNFVVNLPEGNEFQGIGSLECERRSRNLH